MTYLYEPRPNSNTVSPDNNVSLEPISSLMQGIIPRPLASCDLHKNSNDNTAIAREKPDEELSEIPKDLPLVLRRSQRSSKPSTWLQKSLEYLNRPIANNIESENWIPITFKETIRKLDLWWEPMTTEIGMLKARDVYKVIPRPMGQTVVRSKWVYAIKQKDDKELERWKARTVAKEFTQVIGEDYEETYASVARLESVYLICAIAAS